MRIGWIGWAYLSAALAGGGGARGCAPILPEDDTDDTDTTADAGRLEDDEVSLEWRLYDVTEGGGCLTLAYTNLGDPLTDWRFEFTFDQNITAVNWPGPEPDRLSTLLDTARLLPPTNSGLMAYESGSYGACFAPAVRPIGFDAIVTRGDPADDTDETVSDLRYGYLIDDANRMHLSWVGKRTSGEYCLELRVGNLEPEVIQDWNLRIQMDRAFTFTSTDTSFYYFPLNLDQLEVRPTIINWEINSRAVTSGRFCSLDVIEPTSFVATYDVIYFPADP